MNVNGDANQTQTKVPSGATTINDTNIRRGEIGLWLPLDKDYRAVITCNSSRLHIVTVWLLGDFSHHCFEQSSLEQRKLGSFMFHTSKEVEDDYESYPVHVTIYSTEPDCRNAWSCSFLRLNKRFYHTGK